ncbi:MAG: TatD family hydrolase [Bacteroidales bacterium]|nr:TatD family hydrolase [Bacteroidales bacterium]
MLLLDIHTHHPSAEGIRSLSPEAFTPADNGYFSVGIHPWEAEKAGEREWGLLEQAIQHPSVLAIGEAGLDKVTTAGFACQQEVFARQIRLSEAVEKPLVIHCVRAFNELIVLKRKHKPRMPWVVHGFRNNANIGRQLLQEGIFFSLGEKYHPDVLPLLPPERLLAETDESPIPIRIIIERMAAAMGREAGDVCRQIDKNARNIFFRR